MKLIIILLLTFQAVHAESTYLLLMFTHQQGSNPRGKPRGLNLIIYSKPMKVDLYTYSLKDAKRAFYLAAAKKLKKRYVIGQFEGIERFHMKVKINETNQNTFKQMLAQEKAFKDKETIVVNVSSLYLKKAKALNNQ